jgi:hypothetical protein
VLSWTFWCRSDETALLPSVSSSIYCMGCSTSRGASSAAAMSRATWRRNFEVLVSGSQSCTGGWPAQLWRRSASDPARRAASDEQLLEQSSRELASTHSTTRAADAEVQISEPGTAVPVNARDDLRSLPASAPSHGRSRLSMRSHEGVPDLATGDLRATCGVMACYSSICLHTSPHWLTWQCRRTAIALGILEAA